MTGYQETSRTRATQATRLLHGAMVGNYGVPTSARVERATREGALMRSLGGREWADWLREHGSSASTRSTRALVLRLRDAARCVLRDLRRAALPVADGLAQVRSQPLMEGQALVPGSTSSVRLLAEGRRTSPSSTTARSARSCDGSRRRRRHVLRTATSDELTEFEGVLLSNGPATRSAPDEVEAVRGALGRVPISDLPRSSAARPRDGSRDYKLPSGTAARTTRTRPSKRAVLVTSQNTASR